jgi:hypothetical protein
MNANKHGRTHGETQCMELESAQSPAFLYWPRLALPRAEGPAHTKAVMCRTRGYKYGKRLYESDELCDLNADPGGTDDRTDDPALADVRITLPERLLQFRLERGDVVPFETDRRWYQVPVIGFDGHNP